jgi:mRNA interferase YafQ
MRLSITWTAQFKKDYKLAIKRGLDLDLLDSVVRLLAAGEPLSARNRDHTRSGDWVGYRECHIQSDWILIYRVDREALLLTLVRTGSHSDLFGK